MMVPMKPETHPVSTASVSASGSPESPPDPPIRYVCVCTIPADYQSDEIVAVFPSPTDTRYACECIAFAKAMRAAGRPVERRIIKIGDIDRSALEKIANHAMRQQMVEGDQ